MGIFSEVSDDCFALTPLAATLKSDSPGSMRYFAMAQMGYEFSLGWSHGLHSLKTGESAFEASAGMSIWDYRAQHPEGAQLFSRSLSGVGAEVAQAVAASYDFSEMNTIVDVDAAIQPVAGNFFESVPTGGDAYLLRWIIHNWNDESSLMILRNCHQAMPDHAKLLLVEAIIPPGNEPSAAKFLDIIMLTMESGRERSEEEYRSLLQSSGFELTRVIPTPAMFNISIIEAVKITKR